MKHLKKFLEITEYRYVKITEEENNLIENIKDLIIEAEDLGYATSIWLNGEFSNFSYTTETELGPLYTIEIEFNKDKKVPKEDFDQIIIILKRLNLFLEKRNFKIKKISLYNFTKISTDTDEIDILDDEIKTEVKNVNLYHIFINKKDF